MMNEQERKAERKYVREERELKTLEVLRKAAWDAFSQRQGIEWKVAFGIWTVFAVFTAALLTKAPSESFPLKGFWPVLVTALVAFALVSAHAIWAVGIHLNNQRDRFISYIYRDRMSIKVGVERNEIEKVLSDFSKWPTRKSDKPKRFNYNQILTIFVTALLAVSAVLAMYARTHSEPPKTETPSSPLQR